MPFTLPSSPPSQRPPKSIPKPIPTTTPTSTLASAPTPTPAPSSTATPEPTLQNRIADLSKTDTAPRLARRQNRRIIGYTLGLVAVVGSATILGAILKEEWQRRKLLDLRDVEKSVATATANTTAGGGEVDESRKGGVVEAGKASLDGAVSAASAPSPSRTHNERDVKGRDERERQRLVKEQLQNLEARRNELVMKRGEIVAKVERIQERMRKKDAELKERERMSREGGGMLRVDR